MELKVWTRKRYLDVYLILFFVLQYQLFHEAWLYKCVLFVYEKIVSFNFHALYVYTHN